MELPCESIERCLKEASRQYEFLSAGSSRVVYAVNKETVVKVAKDMRGIAQNATEVLVGYYHQKENKNLVALVYDFSPSFTWILSERGKETTKEISSRKEAQIRKLETRYDLLSETSLQLMIFGKSIKSYDYGCTKKTFDKMY